MEYSGPPPHSPPPPGWRPPTVVRPNPPRQLPPQDHAAIDAAERLAHQVTMVTGGCAGAVLLVVMCLLGGQALG